MDLESFFEKNASTKIFTKLLTSKYSIFCQKKTMEWTPSVLYLICHKQFG